MVLQSTSKEPSQLLSVVGMTDAVQKSLVMIRLHACLDTIQRKGRQGGKDTRRRGSYLGAVMLDELVEGLVLVQG